MGGGEECVQSERVPEGQGGESGGCLGDGEKTIAPPTEECPSQMLSSQQESKQIPKLEKTDKHAKPTRPPDPAFSKPPTAAHPKPRPKPRGIQMKLFDSFAKVPPPTTPKAPIVIDMNSGDKEMPVAAVKRETAGGGPRSGLGRKRSRGDPGGAPIVKALKQMEKRAVITCPICSKEFSDITNFDLNQHLDTCLVAKQPPALVAKQPPALVAKQPPALVAKQPPALVAKQPPAPVSQQPPALKPTLENNL